MRSALDKFQVIKMVFKQLTGLALPHQLVQECTAVIECTALPKERSKPVTNFANLETYIKDGVFGDQAVLRCLGEQVQSAAISLLVAFCAI